MGIFKKMKAMLGEKNIAPSHVKYFSLKSYPNHFKKFSK